MSGIKKKGVLVTIFQSKIMSVFLILVLSGVLILPDLVFVKDKWIEPLDTVHVAAPILINDTIRFAKRAVLDGVDYVLSVKTLFGSSLLYSDSAKWLRINRGDMIFEPLFSLSDRSYYRIYRKIIK